MSRPMGKPTICICENKDADQLRGNHEADQRLCFRYTDSILPLLLKSEIASFYAASATVQASSCQTCSETTLLVFPRGGTFGASIWRPNYSNRVIYSPFLHYRLVSSLEKINIENAGNQNHPDLEVRVVLVTCISNIDF